MDGVYYILKVKMKIKLLLLLLFTGMLLTSCDWLKGGDRSDYSPITVYSDVQQRRTINSPLVLSKNGLSEEYLRWIDESMNELTLDIQAQNRQYNINPPMVSIYVLNNCVLSPENKTPSFLIRADSYDGTQYDQDSTPGIGKIYAAEYVIQENDNLTNSWIICQSTDETYVKNASRYGYEHKFLYDYYPDEYDATVLHINNSHPLIPHRGN